MDLESVCSGIMGEISLNAVEQRAENAYQHNFKKSGLLWPLKASTWGICFEKMPEINEKFRIQKGI